MYSKDCYISIYFQLIFMKDQGKEFLVVVEFDDTGQKWITQGLLMSKSINLSLNFITHESFTSFYTYIIRLSNELFPYIPLYFKFS